MHSGQQAASASGVGSVQHSTAADLPPCLQPAEQFGGAFSLVKNDINQNIEVSHVQTAGAPLQLVIWGQQRAQGGFCCAAAEVEDAQGPGPTAV